MKLKLLFTLLLVSSCSTTIKNFDKYEKQFLSKSSFLPTPENLEGKSPKLVVFPFDEHDNEVAKQAGLGVSIANDVENVLTRDRLVEIVDRSAAAKLQKEISLAEMNKTGSYKGPKVADYAISGSISNADFNSKYSSGSTYVNPKNGQIISIPPRFTYTSHATGNIKVYELPSLTVIENIEFSGQKSRSENVQQNGGISLGGLQIGGQQVSGTSRDDGLVRGAGDDGVDEAKVALKNAFAKKGYILEKRVFDKKTIFKISLGSQDGIKQDNEFEVIGQYEVENPITNQTEIERRIITTGKVSDKIDPKSSWVVIEDSEKENSIRLGDAVKIKYKKSQLEAFGKLAKNFAQ